jgi:hypothetical protein
MLQAWFDSACSELQATAHAPLHRLKQNPTGKFLNLENPQMCSYCGNHGNFNVTR